MREVSPRACFVALLCFATYLLQPILDFNNKLETYLLHTIPANLLRTYTTNEAQTAI